MKIAKDRACPHFLCRHNLPYTGCRGDINAEVHVGFIPDDRYPRIGHTKAGVIVMPCQTCEGALKFAYMRLDLMEEIIPVANAKPGKSATTALHAAPPSGVSLMCSPAQDPEKPAPPPGPISSGAVAPAPGNTSCPPDCVPAAAPSHVGSTAGRPQGSPLQNAPGGRETKESDASDQPSSRPASFLDDGFPHSPFEMGWGF